VHIQFKQEICDHVAYSPSLAARDYYVCFHLKKFLSCQSPRHDQETKDVQDWLKVLR
jgi:hypothetical protein